MLPPKIVSYLSSRAAGAPWVISNSITGTYAGAIVIPALAETENLPRTLASLSLNPAAELSRFIILVVVNRRCDVVGGEAVDNAETMRLLPEWKKRFGLHTLSWIDATSSGKELPLRQGVGLARKIGMDLALPHLDYHCTDPLLICLDADTVVQDDYLPAIVSHFAGSGAGGACIPYRHRPAYDPAGQAVIDRYELYLRSYVLGLELAGSPYAFHTVGSAMACRASAYAASGGMNRRLAGEDFYFLQQVHKTSKVQQLTGTVVHPSPRSSQRVPFGTGRAVNDMLTDGEQRLLFYQPVVFSIIGGWLSLVNDSLGSSDAEGLMNDALEISRDLHDFLRQAGFDSAWDTMIRQHKSRERLLSAFHSWFDAFRTMRLIHELSDRRYPRVSPEKSVLPLLERAGLRAAGTVSAQLELLRIRQFAT